MHVYDKRATDEDGVNELENYVFKERLFEESNYKWLLFLNH